MTIHLMNTETPEYIKVKEPVPPSTDCWVALGDRAYEDLVVNNRCGTRYVNGSKVNVILDDKGEYD